MKIRPFIFGKKKELTVGQNPYVAGFAGRSEWNDRYHNMSKAIRQWQFAFFSTTIISIIFAGIVAKMASESRVQPFVVETHQGMPYAVKPMTTGSMQDQRLINFALNQFIINARTIVHDNAAEKILLNKVYAFSANQTIPFMRQYYEQNNPFDAAKDYTVSVNILHALPLSANTWQITWDETKRSTQGGSVVGVMRWVAHVTYELGEVNPDFINDNPFGFYVTHVTWSQSQFS